MDGVGFGESAGEGEDEVGHGLLSGRLPGGSGERGRQGGQ